MIRYPLNEKQLRALLRGEIVTLPPMGQIRLSDIGFDRILAAALDAMPLPWLAQEGYALLSSRQVYHDPTEVVRQCARCGKPYAGPALYCSHVCAVADA